jgi:transposase InsO family protein
MATSKRRITQPLLFHSDRGIQYASKEFRKLLFIAQSTMSRKANCWDNIAAESSFKTLKVELVYYNKALSI